MASATRISPDSPPPEEGGSQLTKGELTIKRAEMHIRILKAELTFLKETGSLAPNFHGMLASLMSTASPSTVIDDNKPDPTTFLETEVLEQPQLYTAAREYLGPDGSHLFVRSGDQVVLSAIRGDEFLGYNTRNNLAGRIPRGVLLKAKSEAGIIIPTVCRAAQSHKTRTLGDVSWKPGDNLRVYQWLDKYKTKGIALNMATKEIGTFDASAGSLKVLD
ncbi:hypothetical protein B0H66DRAFT_14993 [Apodospora peruviana]|uniref:Uncharacterized protein n=1 Tax=Apodospora peruviana TaxID=516989 RepID=A0AAE0IQ89_9PEZI|nr:hypothetical protein B0H66DRAFT_14993 [Apodospora peruviana]